MFRSQIIDIMITQNNLARDKLIIRRRTGLHLDKILGELKMNTKKGLFIISPTD